MPLQIRTTNLLLLPITLDYKDEIFRAFTPEITAYMYPKAPEKIEETIEFITNSIKEYEQGTDLVLVILNKTTNEYLGNAGLHKIHTPTPQFGIWIKKSAHGHGFGKEAITALKNWADQNLKYHYLLYPVDQNNHPSKRIPESLGGKVFREYDEKNFSGKTLHLLEYRIYPEKIITPI